MIKLLMFEKYLKYLLILVLLVIPFSIGQVPRFLDAKQKRMSERGIYITCWSAQSKKKVEYIKHILKTRKLNTVVVDINYVIDPDLLPIIKAKQLNNWTQLKPNPWLQKFTKEMHDEGIIVSVRIECFKDHGLIKARPDLGIKLPGGGLYTDRKGTYWVDPYADEARFYKISMAEVAALSGVDEVQYDYIRFPAEGSAADIVLSHKKNDLSRVDMICQFLKESKERLSKYNVSLAVDIFGVTAWSSKRDVEALGQDLHKMAKYLDVLSPMLYPSHFHNGYDGFANPGSEPYYFLNTGVKNSLVIISTEATVLAPWIQGFAWRAPNYGPEYIRQQVKACRDNKVNRFLIWNARNDYDSVPENIGD